MQTSLVFVGPIPPPVNGQAKNTKIILDAVSDRVSVKTYRIVPRITSSPTPLHVGRKVVVVLRALLGLIFNLRSGNRKLYLTGDGGSGLIFTAALVVTASTTGHRIFLHHRTFAYIDTKRKLMSLIARVGKKRITHIFLCTRMKSLFEENYGAVNSRVVSNAQHTEIDEKREISSGKEGLTIGLLSNLGAAKGLNDFILTLNLIRKYDLPVDAILAGPTENEEATEIIQSAERDFGTRLEYRGPVYGAEKTKFYQDIDIFLFPTRYKTEAQPNVVFEAMAHGCAVIAFDRGCIGSDLAGTGNLAVPVQDSFSQSAVIQLQNWLEDSDSLFRIQTSSRDHMREAHDLAVAGFDGLIDEMTGDA